jgi:hypothetical protein
VSRRSDGWPERVGLSDVAEQDLGPRTEPPGRGQRIAREDADRHALLHEQMRDQQAGSACPADQEDWIISRHGLTSGAR